MELEKIETKLSLFTIQAELRGLVEQRCDALDRLGELQATQQSFGEPDGQTELAEAIEETNQELAALDGLIRQYITKELEKVDSTANVILDLGARSMIHRAEAERLYMLARNEDDTVKRIKELVLSILDEFGEKRFRGKVHDLVSKGNGGVQALTIAQPDLVPDQFRMVNVKMSLESWREMRQYFERAKVVCEVGRPEPNNSAIRNILESSIKQRAEILADAERLQQDDFVEKELAKLPGVPGCRLEPRGKHLEIK